AKFTASLRDYVSEFENIKPNDVSILEPDQVHAIEKIKSLTRSADTPLQRLEHTLRPIALFVVMPIFALANAGISLEGITADDLLSHVVFGGYHGLVIGTTLVIFGMAELFVILQWATLTKSVSFRTILGLGMVAGIGFTMLLFIAALAFGTSSDYLIGAKIGI